MPVTAVLTINRQSTIGPFKPTFGTRAEVAETNFTEAVPLAAAVGEELHFTRAG
jgi:hypothetical protein